MKCRVTRGPTLKRREPRFNAQEKETAEERRELSRPQLRDCRAGTHPYLKDSRERYRAAVFCVTGSGGTVAQGVGFHFEPSASRLNCVLV